MDYYHYCLIVLIAAPSSLFANEYPTQDTVRHVVNCMAENGGQKEENLYVCTCRFDVIKSTFTFEDYELVMVYRRNTAMSGEKAGVFRHQSKKTKELIAQYSRKEKEAQNKCPLVKQVSATKMVK